MLTDPFGRQISYLRISVTDRCDFRCQYCMAEDMQFVPRSEVLTLEEILAVARVFVEMGVSKIRITGGEPLVRRNVEQLLTSLSRLDGLRELVLTTNGARLGAMAPKLKAAGVRRINISLDSLRPDRFREITRTGRLEDVLAGIEAARQSGFERIRLNSLIMRGRNEDEINDLVEFALSRDLDICFIEEMPLGRISSHERTLTMLESAATRAIIGQQYELLESTESSGGPSRYYRVAGYARSRIGFISPHSNNFCASCNRVRLTAEGRLLLCLGNEHSADLRTVLRNNPDSDSALRTAIAAAIRRKPERHHFDLGEEPQILRFMNATGG